VNTLPNRLRRLPVWKRLLWAVGFWVGLCLMAQAALLILWWLTA